MVVITVVSKKYMWFQNKKSMNILNELSSCSLLSNQLLDMGTN